MSDRHDDGPPSGPWEAQRAGRSRNDQLGGDRDVDCSRQSGESAGPRCPDCLGGAGSPGLWSVLHAESCPTGRTLAALRREDAARLVRQAAFTRALQSVERQELAIVTGRLIPRRDRKRWKVVVLRAEGGRAMRGFTCDGRTAAVVTDPAADGDGWVS